QCALLSSRLRLSPRVTFFPYTTLFRSHARVLQNLSSIGISFLTVWPQYCAVGVSAGSEAALGPCGSSGLSCCRSEIHEPGSGHRSEEHTSELQSRFDLVCRLLLEKQNN